jgi:hypothetical protein
MVGCVAVGTGPTVTTTTGANEIIACTNCGGGPEPSTHPSNNGCHGSINEVQKKNCV